MKKILMIVGIVISVLMVSGGVLGFTFYRTVRTAFESFYESFETEVVRDEALCLHSQQPFSVLLLGIDSDDERALVGRSDTMMVVTLNPSEGSTNILSLARDTRVEIVGKDFEDKINHAYAFGGTKMAINTVQNFLNIPIDYFVEIDMDGFEALIDAVGGVTVDNSLEFSMHGFDFPIGTLQLSGAEALAFARMRYEDPRGEFGRQERQRNVLESLMKELTRLSFRNYRNILGSVGDYMATNLTLDKAISMAWHYRSALNEVNKFELRGDDTYIEEIYYQVVPEEDILTISTELRRHLELE